MGARDVLYSLISWAIRSGWPWLSSIGLSPSVPRALLYADDDALFFKPLEQDCAVIAGAFRRSVGPEDKSG